MSRKSLVALGVCKKKSKWWLSRVVTGVSVKCVLKANVSVLNALRQSRVMYVFTRNGQIQTQPNETDQCLNYAEREGSAGYDYWVNIWPSNNLFTLEEILIFDLSTKVFFSYSRLVLCNFDVNRLRIEMTLRITRFRVRARRAGGARMLKKNFYFVN